MDPTTRPYARRILLQHLALLLAVVVLVSLASYEVYHRTRDQIVTQARSRQELLAKQTASAIDSYYASIAADLSLLRRTEDSATEASNSRFAIPSSAPAATAGGVDAPSHPFAPRARSASALPPPPRLLRPLWNQLSGRASHLLYVNRQTLQVIHAYPEETDRDEVRILLRPFAAFLRDLNRPGVSHYRATRDGGINLIAVPLNADYVLAAVIPVSTVEQQFFHVVNRDPASRATLLDETGVVMVTSDVANPAFAPITPPADHPTTRAARHVLARMNLPRLDAGTVTYRDRLITIEPVSVDERTFRVVIESPLAEITAAANTMFARAFIGAIFVILSVTAILVSTALRLIRAQQNIERMRHEMLTRELDQARAIQLHWLPSQSDCPRELQIAAVNQTANHISGDFYDWFTLPDGRGVVTIGDVTGHGMSAAFLMATTQLLVRTTLRQTPEPAACLELVNRQLCAQSFHGQFVTILILVLDPAAQTLSVATAGHMPPLLRTQGPDFRPLPLEPQLPLGIDPDTAYTTETYPLSADSTLLLYTDGTPDAAAPDQSRFGLARLVSALNAAPPNSTPRMLLDSVLSTLAVFRGPHPLADDLTLVALSLSPALVSEKRTTSLTSVVTT